MKKEKKIVKVDTVACLKHKYSDFELHLKNDDSSGLYRRLFPLNFVQIFLWWVLGFKYISGPDYINLMCKRVKEGKIK